MYTQIRLSDENDLIFFIYSFVESMALSLINFILIIGLMKSKDKTLTNIIKGIESVKGENISIIDFTEIENTICKYFVICDCQSNTQVNAISSSIKRVVSKNLKEKPLSVEGLENKNWILLDYIDVVVHVFKKEFREIYDLEELWGEAKIIRLDENL